MKSIRLLSSFFFFATVLFFTSCQKELSTNSSKEDMLLTIGDMLKAANDGSSLGTEQLSTTRNGNGGAPSNPLASARSNAKFSVLTSALARTGLLNTLMKLDGDYTLFAPTDDAFADAGITVSALNQLSKEDLSKILLYHVVSGKIPASAVPASAAVETLNGAKIFVRKGGNTVKINLSTVTLADVMAKNGVVHVIDKVLMPPTQSIVDVVVNNPNFSLLKTAVLRASEGTTNVAALLSGAGPFTVFAPTDAAFTAAGLTSSVLSSLPPDALTPILGYHVISGAIFSIDLSDGITPAMLLSGTTTITLAGGPKIKGAGNSSASNITVTDILTINGVIHVIDGVLLP